MSITRGDAMTMVTASVGSRDAEPRAGDRNESVWRKFLDAVLEPRTVTDKNEIFEYLHCYRHDLPPAVLIENGPQPLRNCR